MTGLTSVAAGLFDPAALTPGAIAAAGLFIFGSAVLRGFTGFGFAIAAVPLLSLVTRPVLAVPFVLCLQLFGSLLDFREAARSCHWPSLTWLTLGAALGSPIGILALSLISAASARLAIAAATATAVAVLSCGFALRALPSPRVTVPVGILSGLFNGLAAMPGPPVVAYYLSAPLRRVETRASMMVFFLLNSVIALASAAMLGLVGQDTVLLSLLTLPVMYAGNRLGLALFGLGSDAAHRRVAIGSLAAIALATAAKGIGELL